MSTTLLDSLPHHCFHTPRMNRHQHPDLYRCTEDSCRAAVNADMVKAASLQDPTGKVKCPGCGCGMELHVGETKYELHVKLCLDETIHYPEMRKAGKVDEATFAAWKATLTRDELMGRYKRVPDHHLVVSFTADEAALMKTDLPSFNKLMLDRVRETAGKALVHQVSHRHETTQVPDIHL